MQAICIIGTDTEIGKTYTCCKIMQYLANQNHNIAALKPISSGVVESEYGLINEDVYNLFKASSYPLTLKQINPFSFSLPIAPHIAATIENKSLEATQIAFKINSTIDSISNQTHILIEGVGGLMVPLNSNETYLDLLKTLNYPIILVIGLKLGCLNHALLTKIALQYNELPVAGFIVNKIDPNMKQQEENIDYLIQKLDIPLLATINHSCDINPTNAFKELFKCQ